MKKLLVFLICLPMIVNATTINVDYIANGQTFDETTCNTGSTLTIPQTVPTKYGYTFTGWTRAYERLDYIVATGTQGINTGVSGFNNGVWEIYAKWMSTDTVQNSYAGIVRVYQAENVTSYRIIANGTSGYSYFLCDNTPPNSGGNLNNFAINIILEGHIKTGHGATINGRALNWTSAYNASLIDADRNMYVFDHYRGRLYTVWAKKNDVLQFNLIPARRVSDSAVGMYDTVRHIFLTNYRNNDNFIAGPVSTNQRFE